MAGSASGAAPRIALVSGFWGTNIGNAFFNIGGKWILDQVFGPENVAFIQDQPGYLTFNKQTRGNPRHDVNLLRHLDIDYVVLQGPMLTETLPALWHDTLAHLTARGTRLILLSAAFFRYTDKEKTTARAFLRKFPPALISTRDKATYEAVKDLAEFTYDGIDSGFFVSDAYRPFRLAIEPYVAVNFDRYPEPDLAVRTGPEDGDASRQNGFEHLGERWLYQAPRLQTWFAQKGKWQAYAGAFLDRRRLPERIGRYRIVRPEHRFNPHIGWKIYRQPNAVASDEPFTYFNVYANAALTLADRVHACVATLAYGRPAMLFTPSPRAAIFDRLGLGDIRARPVTLAPETLAREKEKELSFLRRAVGQDLVRSPPVTA